MTTRRWPAEWEPQSAIWLSWPHNLETWPGRFESIPSVFAKFVSACAEIVPTKVLVAPHAFGNADQFLADVANVELIECPTNDCWIRDYGPTFVIEDDALVGIDWQYNAWGGKYPPWDDDAAAAKRICKRSQVKHVGSSLGCEGGAIETDGGGRMLTTPDCVITDTRNPGWTKEQIAGEFYRQMGIVEILWLDGGGLEGDDTDGHIDQLARFVDRRNVVCAVSDDPNDPNTAGLESNYRQLRVWSRQTEPQVEVHRLPIPPERRIDDQRVPESYCNFLIVGSRRVIVPTFNSPESDKVAIELLTRLMPNMEIYPLEASELVWGLGAFHCASQQMPRP
jgi:agmatine deiminase